MIKIYSAIFILLILGAVFPRSVLAQGVNLSDNYGFGGIQSLGQVFSLLTKPGFLIAGFAVTIYFFIGAIKFLTSAGDKTALESARKTIIHAIIGMVLLIMAFLVLQYLPQKLGLDFALTTNP